MFYIANNFEGGIIACCIYNELISKPLNLLNLELRSDFLIDIIVADIAC